MIYRWLYILAVFFGPYMTVEAVWNIADIFNGLMAFPNLIAIVALSGVVCKETRITLRLKEKRYLSLSKNGLQISGFLGILTITSQTSMTRQYGISSGPGTI